MGTKKVAKVAAPVVETAKESKPSKWTVYTVRILNAIPNGDSLFMAGFEPTANGAQVPYSRKTSKSGRIVVTLGKVASGRAKLSDAEKAARKADRETVNNAAKSLRKMARAGNKTIALAMAKVASGGQLSDEEKAAILAKLS